MKPGQAVHAIDCAPGYLKGTLTGPASRR
jgi:hypothetical protein